MVCCGKGKMQSNLILLTEPYKKKHQIEKIIARKPFQRQCYR